MTQEARTGESSAGVDDLPDGSSARKVLLFDLDGVRWDKLRKAATPNLDGLAAAGRLGPTMTHDIDVAPTVSGPGHSNVVTGVWPDKHRVVSNDIVPHELAGYPDFLTRLEAVRPSLSTFAVGDWPPLMEQIIGAPDTKVLHPYTDSGSEASLRRTVSWATEVVHTRNPDAGYVYFIHVDSVGHALGGASPEYVAAIDQVDAAVGTILEAVRTRPTYAQEEWLFLVATDHGHTDAGGHGGDEPEVRQIWTLASGAGIEPGFGTASMVDFAPTAYAHLGIDIDPAWRLDGKPMQSWFEERQTPV